MKTILLLIAALLFGNLAAQARLGENIEAIQKRYGSNVITNEFHGLPCLTFSFKAYFVEVTCLAGKSVREEIRRANSSAGGLSEAECTALVQSVAGADELAGEFPYWHRCRDGLIAFCFGTKIIIQTAEFQCYVEKFELAAAQQKAAGF